MAIEGFSIQSLWMLVRRLPPFLTRWYFTREKLAGLVYVDVQPRGDSVSIDLGQTASFQIYLQVINLSPFQIELDRASFDFWCAGVILNASILNRKTINVGEIASVSIRNLIPDGHANQIAKQMKHNPFALSGNIEFNCAARSFPKNIGHLDQINARVFNESARS